MGYNETPMKGTPMFKNRHLQVKMVQDTPVETPIIENIKHIRIDPDDLNKIGKVAKDAAIVVGAVVAGNKILNTACRIAEIYAKK
jgi:hypothetical protein